MTKRTLNTICRQIVSIKAFLLATIHPPTSEHRRTNATPLPALFSGCFLSSLGGDGAFLLFLLQSLRIRVFVIILCEIIPMGYLYISGTPEGQIAANSRGITRARLATPGGDNKSIPL